jgi:hypothetical protein
MNLRKFLKELENAFVRNRIESISNNNYDQLN